MMQNLICVIVLVHVMQLSQEWNEAGRYGEKAQQDILGLFI